MVAATLQLGWWAEEFVAGSIGTRSNSGQQEIASKKFQHVKKNYENLKIPLLKENVIFENNKFYNKWMIR